MTEMLRLLAERQVSIADARISPEALAELTNMVERRIVNSTTAKEVFSMLFTEGGSPAEIVERRGWGQVADTGQIAEMVRRVFAEHARSVEDYRRGKTAAAKFLVGQVMRLSAGKADPREAARLVEARLHADG
jgi:aspartyl-tRNA(Asn)/glutamyl-tRNA(Gln) amidotransferase subunit B